MMTLLFVHTAGIVAQLSQMPVNAGTAGISPGGWGGEGFWWGAHPALSTLTTCEMCLIAWLSVSREVLWPVP